jgi:ubiquinol-cytochrome c reductase iron-sulfur subunit
MRLLDRVRAWSPLVAGGGVAVLLAGGAVLAIAATDETWLQGGLAGSALLVAATALASSARRLQVGAPAEEERHVAGAPPCRCVDPGRRRVLRGGALGVAAVAVAGLVPLRALSRRAERRLRTTAWGPGVRLVDDRAVPLRVEDLELGVVATVWPEGRLDAADSQAVLLRLPEGTDLDAPGRTDWTVAGHVAYSKLCTHMGCPVGLYQEGADVLVCPCHQAVFDVLRGGAPVQGPAPRPLPQLPLGVDDDGFLIATADFPDTVGPGFWSRP